MQVDPKVQLEQRIATLENEVKTLKDEVRRILLDIQEQLLIHYDLSPSDDSVLSQDTQDALAAIRRKQATLSDTDAPFTIKRVSLNEMRARRQTAAPVPGPTPDEDTGQD